MAGFFTRLWRCRNYIIIVATPLLLLPLPLVISTSEAKCGFVIILMALYWCTECIPLAVTALLPVILFPMMNIMPSDEVCIQYLKDSNMLFIGGLLVAIAVEHWNLHKRIALQVLLFVGVKPSFLMIGFMGTTAFLSMWISNTASTAMMLPISNAVLQQLNDSETNAEERANELQAGMEGLENQGFEMTDTNESKKVEQNDSRVNMDRENMDVTDTEVSKPRAWSPEKAQQQRNTREQKYMKLNKGMSLCVCYAASIGGTATLTGTTPNVIMKGQIDEQFPNNGGVINFASWFGFAFPNMILMLALAWLWLQFMFLGLNLKKSFGCGKKSAGDKEAYQVIKDEYKQLGKMSFAEASVLTIFILLVLLWFTREPGFIPGWATVLFNQKKQYVTDGTVAILLSALFFCIPSKFPRCGRSSENGGPSEAVPPLLTWDTVHEKMPWSIILLLGGGFALAHGSEVSGLSKWLGESLIPLQSIPPFAISILLCLLVAMFTECSSNTATTTLFLPILGAMATAIKLHPLYVMFPCTIAASLAFMLPVATPPNAIAFSYGNLKVIDMAKSGFILNILGVITINIAINTWGVAMFNLNEFPSWANVTETP
ncbi:solute carrier family 13 member 2-like [Hippocampus zosterae]|uniref:solute carrier family 13 member 2-like n=1 Tax=Hippocampus zosterae TaxID=109293 RepID=UPI00223E04FB|nr:solute carrier family 13 member 2-like [Hippocampus zosterae]